MGGFEAIPSFMLTLLMMPIVGFAVMWVIRNMIDGSLHVAAGIGAISVLLAASAASIGSKDQTIGAAFLLSLVALMAFFPYASDQIERLELRLIDVEGLDRAHQALAARPDNSAARFAVAKSLYRVGMHAHAIVLSEQTLQSLSLQIDEVKNTSVRDFFRAEDGMTKQWRRITPPEAYRPISCPLCKTLNEPGLIACSKCGKPYLLEIARNLDVKSRFFGRLVLGWALIALMITGVFAAVSYLKESTQAIAVGMQVAIVGAIMAWLFKPPKIKVG